MVTADICVHFKLKAIHGSQRTPFAKFSCGANHGAIWWINKKKVVPLGGKIFICFYTDFGKNTICDFSASPKNIKRPTHLIDTEIYINLICASQTHSNVRKYVYIPSI